MKQLNNSEKQSNARPTIYLAGDSTVQSFDDYWKPEAGWGQMFGHFFTGDVRISNHAIGGRSSKTFLTEGRLQSIIEEIRPGDYLMIQFGHNDATISVPDRYTTIPEYKDYLKVYVNDARKVGAEPILVTPVGRRIFDEAAGTFQMSFPEYVRGMKEVAEELDVLLIDLNALSLDYYNEIGLEATRSVFLHVEPGIYEAFPDGKADDTHFQEFGAMHMARLVAGAVQQLPLPISKYVINFD